jgi:hypothetical protein
MDKIWQSGKAEANTKPAGRHGLDALKAQHRIPIALHLRSKQHLIAPEIVFLIVYF